MKPAQSARVLAAAMFSCVLWCVPSRAAIDSPIEVKISVDAGNTLRTMNPRRLGGTNVAMWYYPALYESAEIRGWMKDLRAGYVRMPGGSWSNVVYWNGNGIRDAKGVVDTTKVGADGYPAVDYRGYARSFLADSKTLHPASGGWHGHSDVKTLHEFIKAIDGTEAMVCPNAGTGRAIDAAEWVKWANLKMGYGVRYWEIGNELGGAWEPGNDLPFGKGLITAEMYTKRYNEMAAAMRKIDPSIKIGSCPFVEESLRDCGNMVDFVSIHTYPGSTTLTDSQMFADISKTVAKETDQVKKWIKQYQPNREKQIEIAYTEWNLGFSVSKSEMFSGLWSSIFLGEIARHGVEIATEWDCFSDLLHTPEKGACARKPEYYALMLWNNYMGEKLISASSNNESIYTYASRSDGALSIMLVNTDAEHEAKTTIQLSNFASATTGEAATLTSREYYWNPQAKRPQWSNGPRIQAIGTGNTFSVTLAPYSITYVRVFERNSPAVSSLTARFSKPQPTASRDAELRFILPAEIFVGDSVRGELIALSSGTNEPFPGTLPPAKISCDTDVSLDRGEVRLTEVVGHFNIKAAKPGGYVLAAECGNAKAVHKLQVKPSIPRPVVFWDFTNPLVTDKETFSSDFNLAEDLSQRANRAVARIDLPTTGVVPNETKKTLLQVRKMPEEGKLSKENVRGVVVDVMISPDFVCDDPDASVTVVMQSTANWWMVLGDLPLHDAKEWKTHQVEVKSDDYIKAMPAAGSVSFLLKTSKPAKGSIYFDKVGFLVR